MDRMSDNTPGAARAQGTGGWAAPLISAVLTLPACLLAYFFGGLMPMACDACDSTQASRFDASYDTAFTVLLVGLGIALTLLMASWTLPWTPRNTPRRLGLALMAPVTVPVAYVAFLALLDLP
jgi:uncharacterized protein (DUF983 family)